jgi:hypothetical protein
VESRLFGFPPFPYPVISTACFSHADITVAGETFPAGDYSVSHSDFANFITLAPKGSSRSFSTVVGPGAPGPQERKITLNFGEVGETHVLQSIQYRAKITRKLDR